MHIILSNEQQTKPEMFPEWCNLACFHHYRDIEKDVAPHFHDIADEVWVWEAGRARGTLDGQSVELRPGVVVYTPTLCVHGYVRESKHSNTGIQPRWKPGAENNNHRKVADVGPPPPSAMRAFWFRPEDNTLETPSVFPEDAFLQSAFCASFESNAVVYEGCKDRWWALLVRQGTVSGIVEGNAVELGPNDLLVVSADTTVSLEAIEAVEVVFATGK